MSLGDVKTLASAPGLSTQHQVPVEKRPLIGIRPSTIRLSVGMEHCADICKDIDQALEKAVKKSTSSDTDEHSDIVVPICQMNLAEISQIQVTDAPAVSLPAPPLNSESFTNVQARRMARLKVLYDQMLAVSTEMEALQQQVRADNEALLKQQELFKE